MKRFFSTVAVAGAIGAAFLAATAIAGSGHRTFAPKDCTKPRVEPSRIVFACADFGAYLGKIDWARWGAHHARGSGIFKLKVCKPSCANGHYRRFPAKVRLRKVRVGRCGGRRVHLFRQARLRFTGKQPPSARQYRKNRLVCTG